MEEEFELKVKWEVPEEKCYGKVCNSKLCCFCGFKSDDGGNDPNEIVLDPAMEKAKREAKKRHEEMEGKISKLK